MILQKFKQEAETEKKEQEMKEAKLKSDLCAYLGVEANVRVVDNYTYDILIPECFVIRVITYTSMDRIISTSYQCLIYTEGSHYRFCDVSSFKEAVLRANEEWLKFC